MVVRGFSPNATDVRPELELIEGRMHKPGLYEAIIGEVAQHQFDFGSNVGGIG